MTDEPLNEAPRSRAPVVHPTDDDLVLHYYDETDGSPGDVDRHLDGCDDCRARYVTLQRVMAMAQASALPQPRASFEEELWQRLAPAVTPRRDWWRPGRQRIPRWALGAGAAIAAGLLLSIAPWPTAAPRVPSADSAEAQPTADLLLLSVLDVHFERVSRLLVEVGNGSGPADLLRARVDAEDLATSNRLYHHAAAGAGEAVIAEVLDDLGRALVELSRAPAELTPSGEARLRNRLGPGTLLFKVRVASATIRQQSAAPQPAVSESETPS
ncbi:MAG: hypothetical protein QF681_01560 [Vicinamibacterales bacterium]|jgi:hypothetical protein|nr:hypothetical protein [Vicinamibacterales bacterium]